MNDSTNTSNYETLSYEAPNNPNAGILIYAMQHLGYDNYVALCDIIDNSIDAGATSVKIYVSSSNKQFRIIIVDNGCGMTEEKLDEALKLGSDTEHDDLSDLGKFGMGLSTAGLSLANVTTVLTKNADSDVLYKSVTNVDVIKKQNAFVKYLGKADVEDTFLFYSYLENTESGTIVILDNCNGVKNKNVTQFANRLKKEIARVFRRFMGKITFEVNDKTIQPFDPLMLTTEDSPENTSEIYSNDDYDIKWTNTKTDKEMTGTIHAKLVLLPNFSQNVARDLGINIPNQGFSILRNNREIAYGFMPWYTKHNRMNRIRGEISFDSALDEAMGVDFKKNGIDMLDSVDHALRTALKPQIQAMTQRASTSAKISDEEEIGHSEAENQINKKSHLLITPPPQKTKQTSSGKKDDKAIRTNVPANEDKAAKSTHVPANPQSANANVRFELYHYGHNGAIFEADLEGKTIVIKWNVDHPFYNRFVVENKDNRTLVSSIDFLIYSLAAAQIQAVGEDDAKALMVENIIATMSTNMKALLS